MKYVEADKVVVRLTQREVREVLLALAWFAAPPVQVFDAVEPDEAVKHRKSAQVAAKVHERIKLSAQTKWSGAAL